MVPGWPVSRPSSSPSPLAPPLPRGDRRPLPALASRASAVAGRAVAVVVGSAVGRAVGRAVAVAVASVVAVVVASGPAHAQSRGVFDPAVTYRVPLGESPSRGPADALVTVVEFSDFGCQYCRRAQVMLEALEQLYPGQLRVVYRHNPLDLEDGTLAAEASMAAAAQGQFWAMHDRLYAASGQLGREHVEAFALTMGLDMVRFRRDLDDRRVMPAIERDVADAKALGLASTPFFFINGRPIRGARPLAVFAQLVDEELARARELVRSGVAPGKVYAAVTAKGRTRGDASPAVEDDYPAGELDPQALYAVADGLPGHATGPDDALVTVVVFSDYECPYCRRMMPALARLREAYASDLRIVYRHLPLRSHPRAGLAAEASVAAAVQGKFWPFHDQLYAQDAGLDRADLERYAQAAGMDMLAFRAALDDHRYLDAVAADAALAGALGIRGTPTLFVNGVPLQGAVSYDYLVHRLVEPQLAEARAVLARGVPRAQVYDAVIRGSDKTDTGGEGVDSESGSDQRLPADESRAAVHAACRARESQRASHLYERLHGKQRQEIRAVCRTYGVDLAE